MAAHDLDRNLKRAAGGTLFVKPEALDLSISWLKDELTIPMSAIHSVVVIDASTPDTFDPSGFQRLPRVLRLDTALSPKACIAIVFSSPFTVGEFKFGAEQGLSISKKERRNGVAADALVVDLPTPEAAEKAAADIQAKRSPNLALALSPLIPSATDSERAQHQRKGRFALAQLTAILILQLTALAGVSALRLQGRGEGQALDWMPVVRSVGVAWLGVAIGWVVGRAVGPMKFKWIRFVPLAVLPMMILIIVPATRTGAALTFSGLYGVFIGWLLMTIAGRQQR